jgi:hypothetical protein
MVDTNDYFANSIALSGTNISSTGTNVGFSGESEEPNHAGVSDPLNSAWWNWTAPASGMVTLDTIGSNFDTTLGVYTGSALNSLSEVASNDDSGTGLQSLVGFTATAGTTYQIAVDGYNGRTGNIDLNLDFVSNDNFANSIALSGTDISTTGTNVGFTGESGELNHAGVSDTLNSAWWNWTAPSSGTVTLNTFGSDYDTTLGVYTGSALNSLSEVASNDDFGSLQSQVVFDAIAGTTYQIAVDGFFSSTGNIDLNLDFVSNNNSNDNFANSIALSGTDISTTGTNVEFTGESGEPNHAGLSDTLNSAWWNWTAPTSGTVTLNTFGSDYDTVLGVYTGLAVDSLSEVASNDDSGGTLQSQVVFDAIAGTTYQIAVDGYFSSTGNIALNLDLVAGFSTGESVFGTPDDNGLTVNALGTDPGSLTGIQANTLSSNSLVFV